MWVELWLCGRWLRKAFLEEKLLDGAEAGKEVWLAEHCHLWNVVIGTGWRTA